MSTDHKKYILLVEDIKEHAELMTMTLEQSQTPVRVDVVDNGIEAKQVLTRVIAGEIERPDMVLLDLSLPMVSGHDILVYIRSVPELKDLPVVITTSSMNTDDITRTAELGVNGYLAKPVQMSQLNVIFERVFTGGEVG